MEKEQAERIADEPRISMWAVVRVAERASERVIAACGGLNETSAGQVAALTAYATMLLVDSGMPMATALAITDAVAHKAAVNYEVNRLQSTRSRSANRDLN